MSLLQHGVSHVLYCHFAVVGALVYGSAAVSHTTSLCVFAHGADDLLNSGVSMWLLATLPYACAFGAVPSHGEMITDLVVDVFLACNMRPAWPRTLCYQGRNTIL